MGVNIGMGGYRVRREWLFVFFQNVVFVWVREGGGRVAGWRSSRACKSGPCSMYVFVCVYVCACKCVYLCVCVWADEVLKVGEGEGVRERRPS